MLQLFLEEGDRPLDRRVAEVLRGLTQELAEQGLGILRPQAGTARARALAQGLRVMVLPIGLQPVIDTAPGHAESASNFGDGLPLGDFQHRQGSTIKARVLSGLQLAFQTPPLPVGQDQGVHGIPSAHRRLPQTARL